MTHCTYHCRACGGHFTSLRAFDKHRDPADKGGERGCWVDESAEDKLTLDVGSCRISGPDARDGVSVFSVAE